MGKRHEAIGIKQAIRFEWMQKAANLLLAGLDAKTIRQELHEFLADRKGNGSEGERPACAARVAAGRSDQTRTFVVNNLMKIWVSPDPELIPFRDASLAFLRDLPAPCAARQAGNPSMALAVHWGMISAVYPFWFNVARQTGRLLALQDQVTQTQIINRLKEQYGDRQTVSRYARFVIRSFVAWGALKDSEAKGCYEKAAPVSIAEPNLAILMFESALLATSEAKGALGLLLNNPAFFPIWFQVGEILDFDAAETDDDVLDIVMDFLQGMGQESNKYARKALTRLYFAIRRDSTIHFYNETNQSIDHVLDIFIRTNHGGTPLAFSDLLMSIAVANWKKDARQQIDDLVDQVRFGSDMEFSINRDFVLKTALMLSDADVRFKVKNFTGDQVAKIEQEWDDIKTCILEVFRLIRSFGLNDAALRAKNAAIPIAYYLFHKGRDKTNGKQGLYVDINNRARHEEERKRIRQWLHMSLLKGVFGGQGDALLTNLRKIIRPGVSSSAGFPLDEIVTDYRGTAKDLTFDDDFIDRLLKTQKDDSSCFSILALLFSDLDYTQSLDIDHLHPAASFRKKRLDAHVGFNNPGGRSFYENPENWNGIANLHLLNSSKNKSKQDEPLEQWLARQNGTKAEDLLIPAGTDLSFGAFEVFVEARATFLKQKLGSLVGAGISVGVQG